MKKVDGKLTFTGLFMIFIVVYGGYCAVKYFSGNMTQKEIESEIADVIGINRGPDLTEEKGVELAKEVLKSKDIKFNPDDPEALKVTIDQAKATIFFSVKFDIEVDYLFFKHTKHVDTTKEVYAYN